MFKKLVNFTERHWKFLNSESERLQLPVMHVIRIIIEFYMNHKDE